VEFNKILNEPHGPNELNEPSSFLFTLHPSTLPLKTYKLQANSYNLFFGPVGDFTPAEVDLALKHGYHAVSFGSQILRTETAALAASAIILSI
jgi:16S rRNA (uracil1498-N3)-methyltransferase